MAINKPYPKIYRHGPTATLGPFSEDINTKIGINNIASYELLKTDLKQIFEFIEPCEQNKHAYSHRLFAILLRACTEVESLCKQIFAANGKSARNIIRFSDLEGAMKLSSYEIKSYGFMYPNFFPFKSFQSTTIRENRSPNWYKAYNNAKHNRSIGFANASLQNVIEAVGGVYTLLVAMYGLGFDHTLKMSWHHFQMVDTPTFFRAIDYPSWDADEKYDYNWEILKMEEERFQLHPLPEIL